MLTVLLKRPSHANSQATSTPTKDAMKQKNLTGLQTIDIRMKKIYQVSFK